MDEHYILHHLVEVEKNAARIVEEAQKTADALVAGSGRALRAEYDAEFRARYTKLEEDYKRGIAEVDAAYKTELDALRTELEGKKPNQAAFNKIAQEFFCAAADADAGA